MIHSPHLHLHLIGTMHHIFGDLDMSTCYGIVAVSSAALAVAAPLDGLPYVQYGALGLCAFMVYFMTKHITESHRVHTQEREKCSERMETIVDKFIQSQDAITKELRQRDCLLDKTNTCQRLETALDRMERHT